MIIYLFIFLLYLCFWFFLSVKMSFEKVGNTPECAVLQDDLNLLKKTQSKITPDNIFTLIAGAVSYEIVVFLTEMECFDPNETNSLGKNLLHYLVNTDSSIVERILTMGVNPDQQDCFGRTPLHYVEDENIQSVILLLDFGADPDIVDNEGYTFQQKAQKDGNFKIASLR